MENVTLLIAIEATGYSSAEYPPIDLALDLIGKFHAGCVDAAGLLNAEIVAWETEAGPQAPAAEIEPAGFVGRAAATAVSQFEEPVR